LLDDQYAVTASMPHIQGFRVAGTDTAAAEAGCAHIAHVKQAPPFFPAHPALLLC
jgi:hypothetical protein